MARVKKEVQVAVAKAVDKLPNEMREKCGLCNRTLYDELSQISANTGAPRRTVCDVFANSYNRDRREEEHIEAKVFNDRLDRIDKANQKDLMEGGGQKSKHQGTQDLFTRNEEIKDKKPVRQKPFGKKRNEALYAARKEFTIPLKISQTTLAEGLAEFFNLTGHPAKALLRACLLTYNYMDAELTKEELDSFVNEWQECYGADSGDTGGLPDDTENRLSTTSQ